VTKATKTTTLVASLVWLSSLCFFRGERSVEKWEKWENWTIGTGEATDRKQKCGKWLVVVNVMPHCCLMLLPVVAVATGTC